MDKSRILRGGYSSGLSTLRGFAALLVFISHLTIIPAPGDTLFIVGRTGVVCFFLMTGYLTITSREKRNWRQYAWNRFLRVYPVYWILMVLMFAVAYPSHSLKSLLLNATLFEEFLGGETILGASWMLPIQIIFFAGVTVFGTKMFVNDGKDEIEDLKRGKQIMAGCMGLGIVTGMARYIIGKPFPTAVFLLIGMSVLGIYYWFVNGDLKKLVGIGVIFEVGFVVAVILSYPTQILRYVISYNLGFFVFVVFEKCVTGTGMIDIAFTSLGKIGFTFFLGAGIPWTLLLKLSSFESPWWMIVIGCVSKFICAVALGYAVTKHIENPLLTWGKRIEKEL